MDEQSDDGKGGGGWVVCTNSNDVSFLGGGFLFADTGTVAFRSDQGGGMAS